MFLGVVPSDVRKIIFEAVTAWQVADIYIGCSGNFTLERMLAQVGNFRLHGCDMSLHTSALGYYYLNNPLKVNFAPKIEGFDWLEPYTRTPEGMLACILLAGQFEAALDREGQVKANSYWQRLMRGYRHAFPEMYAQTVAKILADGFVGRLDSYTCGDVVDYALAIDKHAASGFISFPPFESYDAGKAYVQRSEKLELLFEWQRPTIQLLKAERMTLYRQQILSFPHWVLGYNVPIDELKPYQIGQTKATNRGVTFYVYGSHGNLRLVQPHQKASSKSIPKLMSRMTLGDKIHLTILPSDVFTSLRSQYLNHSIAPSSASMAIGVVVDGYLIGTFAFANGAVATRGSHDSVYMLSDFPVAPTDYPRLSKLVLMAALSRETKLLAERFNRGRVRTLETTAFTNEPSSMKYRGLFKLKARKDNPHYDPNDPQSKKFYIQYVGELGQWSLAEGLATWKQKHAH